MGTAASAHGARPTPSWEVYRGSREEAFAWRALAEGRLREAAQHAAAATELQPARAGGWAVSARAAMGQSDWTGALEAVQALRRLNPEHREGLELLGRVAVELDDAPTAVQAFSALDGLEPTQPAAQLGLALVEARVRHDLDRSIEHLQTALSRDPSLDLSTLFLHPEWAPLAGEEAFVTALNALLAAR